MIVKCYPQNGVIKGKPNVIVQKEKILCVLFFNITMPKVVYFFKQTKIKMIFLHFSLFIRNKILKKKGIRFKNCIFATLFCSTKWQKKHH